MKTIKYNDQHLVVDHRLVQCGVLAHVLRKLLLLCHNARFNDVSSLSKLVYRYSLLFFSLMVLSAFTANNALAAQCGGLNQKSCWSLNPDKWCKAGLKYEGNGKLGGGRCVKPKPKPAKKCGGLNQKSCWSANPKKWCKAGLKYEGNGKPAGGRCVKPKPKPKPAKKCGGLNQKSCWSANPKKWCKAGLKYEGNGKPAGGRCVKPKPKPAKKCGGLNQKSCWSANPKKWCKAGLKYEGNGKPGGGRCVKPKPKPAKKCGGLNQKSCWSANPKKWCKAGLKYVGNGKPGGGRCIAPNTDPTPDCGGQNQKSCWSANPKKWCDDGFKYFGTGKPGQGRCIVPLSDPTPDCGGDGQKSCWSALPKHWCDDGMSYSPGVIPGEGTCHLKISKAEYVAAAKKMAGSVVALGLDNPMVRLRTCLIVPENLIRLKKAMTDRSENVMNRILKGCRVSPNDLKAYGQKALGYPPKTVAIGLSGGLVAGVGVEGSIAYAIPLQPNPDGRYFLTNGLGGGAGAAVGVDVTVGLSGEEMPTKHWAVDKGKSVNFSGKMMGSVSVSIDFPQRGITPNGFTVGGGVGVGAEVGTLIFTRDQYLHNF